MHLHEFRFVSTFAVILLLKMKILLNNRQVEFEKDTISVSEMLILKNFTYRMRIVKINGLIISKEKYDSTIIQNGDDVQMLYLMSGG
jgi:thiamine biosynthesis protein ThiS